MEPFANVWFVLVATGGYALSLIQFFKDFLNVQRLELEIAELRTKARAQDSVIHRATNEEIERFARLKRQDASRESIRQNIKVAASIGFVLATAIVIHLSQKQKQSDEIVATLSSRSEELKRQLEGTRRDLEEKQAEVNRLRKELGTRPIPQRFSHAVGRFVKTVGRFVKTDGIWIEYPEYAPGRNFKYKELRRDHDYLYLVDETRTKDGHPMYVRFPIEGGMAQWSYAEPIAWSDMYVVTPE